MRYKIFFGLALFIGFAGLLYTFLTIPEKLRLEPTEGPAPLHVQIMGPAEYVNRANGLANAWTGCGIRVSWGDGQSSEPVYVNESCASMLDHTYRMKGMYRVDASVGGFATKEGSTGTSWKGAAVAQVK